MNEKEAKVLDVLKQVPWCSCSTAFISRAAGLTLPHAASMLHSLARRGLVVLVERAEQDSGWGAEWTLP